MAKTAIRRRHRARLINKFVRIEAARNPPGNRAVNYDEWLFKAARMYVSSGCCCSCYMCKGARDKYGNGRWARTIAEQHAIEDLEYFIKNGN